MTQPDGHIVSEGNRLELRCNCSYGGSIYLFWYVQYPSQGLQFLLKYLSGPTRVKGIKGFEAEFRKDENSNPQRYMHTNFQGSIIHNSQDMEAIYFSIKR